MVFLHKIKLPKIFFLVIVPVPGPVTEVTFRRVSDSTIIVGWRMPEITNGLILRYNITVTLYSSGEVVYTNVIAAGGQLSDRVTGLGEIHSMHIFNIDAKSI